MDHLLCRASMAAAIALAAMPAVAAPRYEATITRTTYGIPHIRAKNFGGLGFGAAYAQAQDNICLLADAYLTVSGERAKYLGASGQALIGVWPATNLESDVFYRTVLDNTQIDRELARRTAEFRQLLDGWVAGYNRYITDRKGSLPAACAGQPWVRAIKPIDVLRWVDAFGLFASSAGLSVPLANTSPPGEKLSSVATPAGGVPPVGLGSNGWAFGGDATTNGRGLVVGNPHFPWTGAYRFYEMHLTIPGSIDVAGAGITGQPYVGIGFNKDVAWTHTVDTAAHMTLAKLTLDPRDPTAYVVDGRREPMERRTLTIETKEGPAVTRTIYAARQGPIVSLPGTPYAWTGTTAYAVTDANRANVRAGDTYIALARARNVGEIKAALIRYLGVPFINTLAADRAGTAMFADVTAAPGISDKRFARCGTITEKPKGLYAPLYILDGSASACGWQQTAGVEGPQLLPGSAMAVIERRDYVQNSNDSYRWTNPALPPRDRAVMLGRDPTGTPDLRTRSGLQAIGRVLARGKFDIDSGAAAMLSNESFIAPLVLPAMLRLCTRPAAPADACAALATWDGKADIASRGATLFSTFWLRAGTRPDIWAKPFDPARPIETPGDLKTEGTAGDGLLADLAAAAATLKQGGIALDAPLGSVQFAIRGDERIPVSGAPAGGVLNYMAARPISGGSVVVHGSSYIQSVTFDDKGPKAKAVLTYSQSTDPASPYYADQTRAFSRKELRTYPFSTEEIAADRIGAPMTIRQ
jgi:acyl-homoserine-lactone acylase